ncbi:MAG: hypothetical protein COW32_08375 [Candidatus Aquicultor secundus]|uniref:HTH luxR-type domain-containing protein n=1 Tax=Candidatus Aquicultor secundus TaxID=1973895 RepID=A0A2M7T7G6_9ACTN|nr:helix-turn-helix transcriptional regulator [Candidatus Aquicultor secundus]NCO66818.1 helix-turn-helix transcriptional regulator [Solirubrobacter sp.]OIO85473.1 MAG: hypothetical protein AUK32_07140 [Candidatus Aquicultor secundus]PIU27719.1 MAG: hypothetical protein COT10_01975 [Candidatus Aquicultor secundus]PIW21736.1 MAG: hypothetical protein COW32_08375 [Candidatus Aquicultor secundus]PIX52430.1 MAG: hypothetical protein COZ51_04200 [Candidatus Aquicultor secundus]
MHDKQINPQDLSMIDNETIIKQVASTKLTGREKQVLSRLVKGLPYKQIASELSISKKTVEFHSSKIFKKLQVSDRFELADIITQDKS